MRTAARCISSLALAPGLVAAAPALPVAPVSLSALCPKSKPGEMVVCADREPPRSRYLPPLPRLVPEFGTRASMSVSRERNGLFDYDGGGSGLCSASGPGGMFGCAFKQFKAGVQQRASGTGGDPRGQLYEGLAE